MNAPSSTPQRAELLEASQAQSLSHPSAAVQDMAALARRVRGEFVEMPGLRLTAPQAARLFGVGPDVARAVLDELSHASVLTCSNLGAYSLAGECSAEHRAGRERNGDSTMAGTIEESGDGALRSASGDRLACLFRHWTWADEARARFERELANGWEYDEQPVADHPFGAYYHWCALLCGFSEAALEHGLLPPGRLDAIHHDLERSLPGLRACRQVLVVIPASLEQQPRVVDLLGDQEPLGRLRRIHEAFGAALREERMSREIDSLDH
jgi:hypothetical protein